MKILLALGCNALLKRGDPLDVYTQRKNIATACSIIAPLAHEHEIIITYGNGPQAGLLAHQAEAFQGTASYPLDVPGAAREGMIGYLLEQEMINARPGCPVTNLLTQTLVDADDPAFNNPVKFIGPAYTRQQANLYASKAGWTVKQDGTHFRRVVPSPKPVDIIDLPAIRILSDAGFMVICAGGGGVPLIRNSRGMLSGVEAVVDKDLAAARLAAQLGTDALLLVTDVDAVYCNWGTPEQTRLFDCTVSEMESSQFAPDTMEPKVMAACCFARETGKTAYIGSLDKAAQTLSGELSTTIRR